MRTRVELFLIRVREIFNLKLLHLNHHLSILFSLLNLVFLHHQPLDVAYLLSLNLKVILVLVKLITCFTFHIEMLCDLLIMSLDLLSDLVGLILNITLVVFHDLHLLPDAFYLKFLSFNIFFNFL
jgi:hypothetical protein